MRNQNRSVSLYYLYGLSDIAVLSRGRELNLTGVEGHKVEFMAVDGLIVFFGRLPAREYTKDQIETKIKNANWLENKILEHYQVQEVIMSRCGTIIPFKFCTLFKTQKKVREFVKAERDFARKLLQFLHGRQEWSVKIFRNKELIKKKLGQVVPEFCSRIIQIKSNGRDGWSFLMEKKLLQDIDATASKFSTSETANLIEDLKELSVETRQNDTFSVPERKNEDMLANMAFLVNKDNTALFIEKVKSFNCRNEGIGIFARCSGPWLPYNFVNVPGVSWFG